MKIFLFIIFTLKYNETEKAISSIWLFPRSNTQEYRVSKFIEHLEKEGARIRTSSLFLKGFSAFLPKHSFIQIQKTSLFYTSPVHRFKKLVQKPVFIQTLEFSDSVYGESFSYLNALNIPELHKRGITGNNVPVGMLDTGFDFGHPALQHLKEYNRIIAQHDFNSGDHLYIRYPSDVFLSVQYGNGYINSFDFLSRGQDSLLLIYSASHDSLLSLKNSKPNNIWAIYALNLIDKNYIDIPAKLLVSDTFAISPSIYSAGDTLFLAYQYRENGTFFVKFKRFIGLDSLFPDTIESIIDSLNSKKPLIIFSNSRLYLFYYNDEGLKFTYSQDFGRTWFPSQVLLYKEILDFKAKQQGNVFYGIASAGKIWEKEDSLFLFKLDSLANLDTFAFIDMGFSPDFAILSDGKVLISYVKSNLDAHSLGYKILDSLFVFSPFTEIARNSYIYKPSLVGENTLFEPELFFSMNGLVYSSQFLNGSFTPIKLVDSGYLHTDNLYSRDGIIVIRSRGDDNAGFEQSQDNRSSFFHGTRMMSLIAGLSPYELIGAAPGVKLALAKTEKVYTLSADTLENIIEEDYWVEGMEWLISKGVRIISSSLGYIDWYRKQDMDGKTPVSSRAASKALGKNCLIVTAMGNVDSHVDTLQPDTTVHAPGDADSVLTIGGAEWFEKNWRAHHQSAYGPTADGRIKPDLIAPFEGWAVYIEINPETGDTIYEYSYAAGTSISTAYTAGLCALLLEAHPSWNAMQLMDAIKNTAHNKDAPDNLIGWGMPDALKALYYEPPEIPVEKPVEIVDQLFPPYPNPWNAKRNKKITFKYIIWENETYAEFRIYDLSGTMVYKKILGNNGFVSNGTYKILWNGKDLKGRDVPSGIYIAVLYTGFNSSLQKFSVIR